MVELLVLGHVGLVAAGREGLAIYRLGERGEASRLGELETEFPARRVSMHGELAILSYGGGGVDTIDLADPSDPKFLGKLRLPRGYPVWRFHLEGDLAYVASLEYGFGLVDLADPATPSCLLPSNRPMTVTFP